MFQIYNEQVLDLLSMEESGLQSRISHEDDAFSMPLGDQTQGKRVNNRYRQQPGTDLKIRMNEHDNFVVEDLTVY